MSSYQISVKAVLDHGGRQLLRRNERNEWELLGGRIEHEDEDTESCLLREIREESGIEARIVEAREPWLYDIGGARTVLIVPFFCEVVVLPEMLEDEDGGYLAWHGKDDLSKLPMPEGYLDTINGLAPRHSFSPLPETQGNAMLLKPKVVKPWRPFPTFRPTVVVRTAKQLAESFGIGTCSAKVGSRELTSSQTARDHAIDILRTSGAAGDPGHLLQFQSVNVIGDTASIGYLAFKDEPSGLCSTKIC